MSEKSIIAKEFAESQNNLFVTKADFSSLFNIVSDQTPLSDLSSPERSLTISAYKGLIFACIDARSEAISLVDWKLKRKNEEVDEDDYYYKLLKRPNPLQTWTQFSYLWQSYEDLFGEVYIYIVRNRRLGGVPVELYILPTQYMKPVFDTKKPNLISHFELTTVQNGQQRKLKYSTKEIAFFKNSNPKNPARGIGRLELALLEIDIHNFSKMYVRNFYKNGAVPQGVLTTEKPLTETDIERLRRQWMDRYGGTFKSWSIAILGSGLKYEKISTDPASSDFIKQALWSRDDILSIFKVPPIKLGILSDSNKANSEVQSKQFARDVVAPNIRKKEEFMNYVLFPLLKANDYRIEFSNPIPEDEEINTQKAKVGGTFGILTINEMRKLLGFEPIEDSIGDQLVEPLNLPQGRQPDNEQQADNNDKKRKLHEKLIEYIFQIDEGVKSFDEY